MSRTRCLTSAELAAFHLGDLPEGDLEELAGHLERCPACQEAARALDGLYARLRSSGTSDGVDMVGFAERNDITGLACYDAFAAEAAENATELLRGPA